MNDFRSIVADDTRFVSVFKPPWTQNVDGLSTHGVLQSRAMRKIEEKQLTSQWKEAVAARIKQAMREYEETHQIAHLTFVAFSDLCQKRLSKSRLSNYANAQRLPKPWECNIMGAALGCDAAWLMCLDQEFNKQELDLVKNFRKLPERDRNSYSRRIAVLALAYAEPAPDEPPRAPDEPPKPSKKRHPTNH